LRLGRALINRDCPANYCRKRRACLSLKSHARLATPRATTTRRHGAEDNLPMMCVALLLASGGVKAPRSASIAGASGIHHGKQLVPVLRQPVPRVLRQPVPRALRQQAPRGRLRPGLHWGGIFRREFGESPGHSRLPRWRCRGRRVRAKSQLMRPTLRSGALN